MIYKGWFIKHGMKLWWVERPGGAFWSRAAGNTDARRIIDDQLEITLGGQVTRNACPLYRQLRPLVSHTGAQGDRGAEVRGRVK
jgi:hypothetical protein